MRIFIIGTFGAEMFQSNSIGHEDGTRTHLARKSSLSRPHPVLVLSSSPKFEIYPVLVPSRPKDELGRGPSQDDSSRPTDPCLYIFVCLFYT